MIATSYGTGRIQASEADAIITSKRSQVGARGVVYCHQGGATALTPILSANTGTHALIRAIAEVFPVSSQDQGAVGPWGNTTAQTRIGQQKTWLQAAPVSAATGKVILVGISQGATAMFNWAIDNPTLVAAMLGVLPVCDLTDIYENNRGGAQAGIGTAWGVTPPDALPAGADPAVDPSPLVGIPCRLYYASDDTTVLPAKVTAFASAIGATATNLGTLGHTEAAIAAVPRPDVVEWLRSVAR